MFDFKSIRPLDAVIGVIAVVVIALGLYLGYSVWSNNQATRTSTPAARAVAALTAQVRKNPNDMDKRMRLAQALQVAGRTEDAVDQYKAILTVNKEFVPALSGLGFIALQDKQYKTGAAYYRKVADLLEGKVGPGTDAQLETAYFYLGNALMEQKDYEAAAGYFKQALRLKRDASDTHYLLAVCLNKLDREAAYEEELNVTLMFDPKHPEANLDYGLLLLSRGDEVKAASHFRRAADAAPNAPQPLEAMKKLGTAEARLAAAKKIAKSDPPGAVEQLKIATSLDPQSIESWLLMAKLYEDYGKLDKAATSYSKALAIDSANQEAVKGLERVKND